MKYQVTLVCLVNTLLQGPCKMAQVIPNLEQFFKAFLRECYTRRLLDLTGAVNPIKREPYLTVFMPLK